jgi:rare lipoprotein A
MYQMTAAHPSLPFGTWVLVENSANGRSVKVRINDRGPNRSRRILDLSYAAARALGAIGPGVIPVRLRVIAPPESTRGLWRPLSHSTRRGEEPFKL